MLIQFGFYYKLLSTNKVGQNIFGFEEKLIYLQWLFHLIQVDYFLKLSMWV